MSDPVPNGGPARSPGQVFVDDSGRRSRWLRLAGMGVTVVCAGHIGIVAVGLSQTGVGSLLAVPAGGNGEVAVFPDTAGIIPGLLAGGGAAASRSRPLHRTTSVRKAPAAKAPAPTSATTTSAARTATGKPAKSTSGSVSGRA